MTLSTRMILAASLISLAGCDKTDDGDTASDEQTSTDGDTGDGDGDTGDGDGDTGDGDGDGDLAMCPDPFPSFAKACVDAGECTIAMHQTDCCGSMSAFGINTAEQAAFEAVEAVCASEYPLCECAPTPTSAEDGNSSEDPSAIVVDCVAGSCTTSIL